MALDLNAIRARLGELKGNTARTEVLWKPKEGENLVRIVPRAGSPNDPFIELYFHYLGGKTYLSPLTFGEPDPINEFGQELRSGGGLSKEDWKETKKFDAQRRTYVPVIDRNKPELGVRYWAFGKTVYGEILAVMNDPEYGDITDPQTGRDIKVIFTPQEKSDTSFAKTQIRVSPSQKPLTKDADELKRWLTEQPDLMSTYTRMSYNDMKDVLEKYVNGTKEAAPRSVINKSDEDWGEVKAATTKVESAKKINDEFTSLFGS